MDKPLYPRMLYRGDEQRIVDSAAAELAAHAEGWLTVEEHLAQAAEKPRGKKKPGE